MDISAYCQRPAVPSTLGHIGKIILEKGAAFPWSQEVEKGVGAREEVCLRARCERRYVSFGLS